VVLVVAVGRQGIQKGCLITVLGVIDEVVCCVCEPIVVTSIDVDAVTELMGAVDRRTIQAPVFFAARIRAF
jgi:hypothetical protein